MMSPTLTTRLSTTAFQATRRHISTTSLMLNTLASGGAQSSIKSTSWRWRNLSPQARRYAVAGLTATACADIYVHYRYWPQIHAWFQGETKTGEN
ncbi:hypothetical protein FSARC_1120 [Fusarium sarcochroum]|uniref:Uncharacterized protein n=1 Tax=Fusarium sarcochroum TaxID=1208366 RepID=A0A8H4U9R9_9HYPO|nr:hypothetical protein FSARC_1120 [Fusarium sarcochroum]